jgi:hypothetical protein
MLEPQHLLSQETQDTYYRFQMETVSRQQDLDFESPVKSSMLEMYICSVWNTTRLNTDTYRLRCCVWTVARLMNQSQIVCP